VAEWQEAMSSHEFAEWMAFAKIQPFGEVRADFRFASLQALIANTNRDPKKSKPFTHEAFMPDFERAIDELEEQEEVPEHARVWQKIKSVFGALAKRRP
jgi:hypothetical protein